MEYIVVTKGNESEVWGTGFYGDYGKNKAQVRIDSGYFHDHMFNDDKNKELIVIEVKE